MSLGMRVGRIERARPPGTCVGCGRPAVPPGSVGPVAAPDFAADGLFRHLVDLAWAAAGERRNRLVAAGRAAAEDPELEAFALAAVTLSNRLRRADRAGTPA